MTDRLKDKRRQFPPARLTGSRRDTESDSRPLPQRPLLPDFRRLRADASQTACDKGRTWLPKLLPVPAAKLPTRRLVLATRERSWACSDKARATDCLSES